MVHQAARAVLGGGVVDEDTAVTVAATDAGPVQPHGAEGDHCQREMQGVDDVGG
jgi:hypothetical protein